jgi:hypothetical protein
MSSSIKRKVDEIVAKDASNSSGSSPSTKTSKTREAGKLKNDDDAGDASNNDSNNETKRDEESIDSCETSTNYEDAEEEAEEEEEDEEEEPIRNIQTCSNCRHFCASWTHHYARGSTRISCETASHHGDRYCPYDGSFMLDAAPRNSTTEVGMGSPQGCTVDQRVAFLCSLYKLASKTSEEFRIFSDPQFLQLVFKDLIHEPKVIKVAVL